MEFVATRPGLARCRLIDIPRYSDARGTLSVIEGETAIPFRPQRFCYIHDLVEDALRGCHAHKSEEELVIAIAGRFKVAVSDDIDALEFELDRPGVGLYIPPFVWHELYDFAPGTICAVLASRQYDPAEYFRSHDEFCDALRATVD